VKTSHDTKRNNILIHLWWDPETKLNQDARGEDYKPGGSAASPTVGSAGCICIGDQELLEKLSDEVKRDGGELEVKEAPKDREEAR
jgi:hypothetical protein